jgi:peptide deformylase
VSILPVRLFIDPILHQPCQPVTDFSNLQELAESMLLTMYANKGIGLSANQVGVSKQFFVANIEDKSRIIMVANPKILCYNKEIQDIQVEGCLSAPGISINMQRPTWVEFEYQKLNGEKDKMRLERFDARIFWHEFSHLQGKMITDSIGKL